VENLIEALERIMNWLRKHQPEYADSFLPGLTSAEIQAVEAEFGYKLPEEIYTLYQWRNGTEEAAKAVCFPPALEILPLSTAIEYSQEWNEFVLKEFAMEENKWYETSPLFKFLQSNCDFCAIPLIDFHRGKLPVVVLGEGELPSILYTNLTDMMLTLAECYETNAYYLGKDGYIYEDQCQTAVALRKYNNELNEKALSDFKATILQPVDFSNQDVLARSNFLSRVGEITGEISRFKDPEGVELLLQGLENWSKSKGLIRDQVYSTMIAALSLMCDKRVLQHITNYLEDDSPSVRKEAEASLLRFRKMRRNI
jgi:cell wall assembly regulator SMI1